jgi:DNA-binding HxlR family transcriptional regulator
MLYKDLRQMQGHDLIARKDYQEVPPRVAYSATPFDRELGAAMGRSVNRGVRADSMLGI